VTTTPVDRTPGRVPIALGSATSGTEEGRAFNQSGVRHRFQRTLRMASDMACSYVLQPDGMPYGAR